MQANLRPFLVATLLLAACSSGGGSSPKPACTPTCTLAGDTQCSGVQVQTCTPDANSCLHWSAATACASGKSCSSAIGACQFDPCNGVPTAGLCADAQTIRVCATATGQATPAVYSVTCPAGSSCSTSGGTAHCADTGSCTPGVSSCVGTVLHECNAGTPVLTTCPGACLDTALGSMCSTSSVSLTPLTFTVKYSVRPANSGYTDWSATTFDAPLSNLLILSQRGSTTLDAQTTDSNGTVTISVPATPTSGDGIFLIPAASDGAGGLAFMVANPNFASAGQQPIGTVGAPQLWSWSDATANFVNNSTITIGEAQGSGVLRVFDYLRYAYYRAGSLEGGTRGKSLVVWVGFGTSWSCGSCFGVYPTTVAGLQFDAQMWLGGDSNQQYWSDAVTAHELGHWVMASYGTSPGEGGTHILGNTSFPGLSWSEGWATWHSSNARASTVYYDKQGGTMFWLDIAADQYSNGAPWQLPTPAGGLLQRIDENEVSSMLWSISSAVSSTDVNAAAQPLFTALSSPRMNTSPFKRGYTRHTWQLDGTGQPIDVVDTLVSAPCLADFLDALDCAGLSHAIIDGATVPATRYPYNSASPVCQ